VARGGFSSVMFAKDAIIDKRIWKNVNKSSDEWMPRLNTPEGKAMDAKLKLCITADYEVLNSAIEFDASPFQRMGFSFSSKEYYGIEVLKKWEIKMPADCKEVTETVYDKTFKRESK